MDRILFWLFGNIAEASSGQSVNLKELTQLYRLAWFYLSLFVAAIFVTLALSVTDFIQYTSMEIYSVSEPGWMQSEFRKWEQQPLYPNLTKQMLGHKIPTKSPKIDSKDTIDQPECLVISKTSNSSYAKKDCVITSIGNEQYKTRFQVVLGMMLTQRSILVRNFNESIESFYWFECFTNCPKPYALRR